MRWLLLVVLAVTSCGGSSKPAEGPDTTKTKSTTTMTSSNTKVTAFAISNAENLRVDKVGMRDGSLSPDGSMDLVFTATIDGPFDAIFVYATNEKGEPSVGLRADTVISNEEVPAELGSVVDTGKMTFGIGVIENGVFINRANGSVSAAEGLHQLTFYVSNSSNLKEGDFVRLWVRSGNGLIASPVVKY